MAESEQNPLLRYLVNNPDAFAQNLARALEQAGKAAAAYLKPRETGEAKTDVATEELAIVTKTLAHVGEWWLADPARTIHAQQRLVGGWIDLWSSTLKRLTGEPTEPVARPDPRDKRFADPEWQDNAFFDFLKQFYLITSRWADELVQEAEIDEKLRTKADFWMRQITAALAPSNFLLTNPELLRETLTTNGDNLVRGMRMLAEDIAAGGGELKIRQSDATRFEIGKNLAMTPGKVVWLSLIHI